MSTTQLERSLVALGASLEVPPAPDLVPSVLERLRGEVAAVGGPRPVSPGGPSASLWSRAVWSRGRRLLASVAAATLLLGGAAMAVAPSRHALLDLFGLRGVAVVRVTRLPPLPPSARLALGKPIALSRARQAAAFTAVVPPRASAAYLAHDLPGGRITFRVGPLLVEEFRGTATPFIVKLIGPATRDRHVRVNGAPGLYLSGSPHWVVIRDSLGEARLERDVVAGNVLIWRLGPLTVRIEGARTLTQALAVARELRR